MITENILQPKRRNIPGEEKTPNVPDKIYHVTKLLELSRAYFELEKVSHQDRQKAIKGKYRTKDMFERCAVRDALGNVNEPIWLHMTKSAMNGMLKTILNSQNEGDWKVLDSEVEIAVDGDGIENIVMAIRWVDLKNLEDIQYVNGHAASVQVNVKNSFPPELIDRISNSGDLELKELMKQLVTALLMKETGVSPKSEKSE
jgi:hypothetical protein